MKNANQLKLDNSEYILLILETLNELMHEMYLKATQDNWYPFECLAESCMYLIEKMNVMEKLKIPMSAAQRKKKVNLILDFLSTETKLSEHLANNQHNHERAKQVLEMLRLTKKK